MAITDIFKKEESAKKDAPVQKKEIKTAAPKTDAQIKIARKASGQAGRILNQARVTEKASNLAQINQYVFDVAITANKNEIARAVEGYYGVDVLGVNVVNVAGKRRRRAKGIAVGVDYRKAIVTIKKSQSIEIMPK
jgi:large subunit ribosomal protein L23